MSWLENRKKVLIPDQTVPKEPASPVEYQMAELLSVSANRQILLPIIHQQFTGISSHLMSSKHYAIREFIHGARNFVSDYDPNRFFGRFNQTSLPEAARKAIDAGISIKTARETVIEHFPGYHRRNDLTHDPHGLEVKIGTIVPGFDAYVSSECTYGTVRFTEIRPVREVVKIDPPFVELTSGPLASKLNQLFQSCFNAAFQAEATGDAGATRKASNLAQIIGKTIFSECIGSGSHKLSLGELLLLLEIYLGPRQAFQHGWNR